MAEGKFSFSAIYQYLSSGVYPDNYDKQDKLSLRKRSKFFKCRDNDLIYVGGASRRTKVEKLVIESEEHRHRIISSIHDSNHLGVNRTLDLMSKYYWPGLTEDVKKYIGSCEKCQRNKYKLQKASGVLHPIPVTPKLWKQVGMDLIGPMPTTVKGNKYIVTLTDYFTKWAEAAPLPDKTALGVAKFVYQVMCRMGCPETLITDQGREFVNSLSDELYSITKTEHRITSAYHPQSNGLTERFKQTLTRCLSKVVNESQTDWDEKIDTILMGYRASRQSSTKLSPYYMLFQTPMRLPIDNEILASNYDEANEEQDSEDNVLETIESLLGSREKIFEVGAENISKAQKKQKESYDKKHQAATFVVGSKVLLENTAQKQRKGGKMDSLWLGPYLISRVLGKGLYELSNLNKKIIKKKANVSRLKLFIERTPNLSVQQDASMPPSSQSNSSPLHEHPLLQQEPPLIPFSLQKECSPFSVVNSPSPESPSSLSQEDCQSLSSPFDQEFSEPDHFLQQELIPSSFQNCDIFSPCNSPDPQNEQEQDVLSWCDCKTRCCSRKCPCRHSSRECTDFCHPGKPCSNVLKLEQGDQHEVISSGEGEASEHWVEIEGITLTNDDKNTILDGHWLTDNHISAAQMLLKKKYGVEGLQSPTLQYTRTYQIQYSTQFVQCLHVKNNHWITISTIDCLPGVVNVYDTMHERVPVPIKNIIADLIQSDKESIILKYANMQFQEGVNDCGLFAVATATALCNGDKPQLLDFDQSKMRKHFQTCLQNQDILPFPSIAVAKDQDYFDKEEVEIFCVCRQMDTGHKMISCDECRKWYHASCLRVPRRILRDKKAKWFCKPECRKAYNSNLENVPFDMIRRSRSKSPVDQEKIGSRSRSPHEKLASLYSYDRVAKEVLKLKPVLVGIMRETVPSTYHDIYKRGTTKQRRAVKVAELRGPIKKWPPEQMLKLLEEVLLSMAEEVDSRYNRINYGYNVLLPEAMIRVKSSFENVTVEEALKDF